jgi:hypothetical protein
MKKLLLLMITFCLTVSCKDDEADKQCGTYNGQPVYLTKYGSCYYIDNRGYLRYLDRGDCKC